MAEAKMKEMKVQRTLWNPSIRARTDQPELRKKWYPRSYINMVPENPMIDVQLGEITFMNTHLLF